MDTFISFLSGGLLQASWWQVLLATLVMTHITILCVTIFLHRSQTHRGLDLHPAIAHFFRFWLWMTTGMVTKEWVAIHRKHHARCEREGDPHSPMLFGVWKVLFRGAELYRHESENQETMAKFGHGTPNDWLERNLYTKHSATGILLMLIIDLLLFGVVGLSVWAVQMAWIPFWAAGVVNGIGHYWGYRNFASPDTSTNVFPWGIIIGGEELHNNHHAHASSAKFSSQWYEFDIGWVYIRAMQAVGLAKVRKVAPKLKLESDARSVDLKTLHGVITHRYEIMARYADLLKHSCSLELQRMKAVGGDSSNAKTSRQALKRVRNWFHLPDTNLHPEQLAEIDQAMAGSQSLSTLMQMRKELGRLWESSSASSEQLLNDLQGWCQRAQQSGIQGLADFASRLRRYAA